MIRESSILAGSETGVLGAVVPKGIASIVDLIIDLLGRKSAKSTHIKQH